MVKLCLYLQVVGMWLPAYCLAGSCPANLLNCKMVVTLALTILVTFSYALHSSTHPPTTRMRRRYGDERHCVPDPGALHQMS